MVNSLKKPVVYILIGVPASGKSTWCQANHGKLFRIIASSDSFIEEYAKATGKTYSEVFKDYADAAQKFFEAQLMLAVEFGDDVAVDRTNMSRKSRQKVLSHFPETYKKVAVVFPTPDDETLNKRLASRPGKIIPESVMKVMKASFEFPTTDEGFDEIITIT